MFKKMTNQQVYQSLFPMANVGLYDILKPVQNYQVTITNTNEISQKKEDNSSCCDDGCEECKCDGDTLCKCKNINDFLEQLEIKY